MPLLLIVGTGTEIGKTHLGEALLRHLTSRDLSTLGYKPVESGVPEGAEGEDARRLRLSSSFHVKHFPLAYRLPRPVSPHIAARDAHVAIDLDRIVPEVLRMATEADVTLVELAGGLFSPLTEHETNAHLARRLPEAFVLLVAPDRLGVLHDLGATTRAAHAMGLTLHGIALSTPAIPDASTGHNAAEIRHVTRVPLLAVLPRDPAETLAAGAPIAAIADAVLAARQ